VSCNWVFKKKLMPDATIDNYKSRHVANVISKKKVKISLTLIHLLLV
jgi:hypothetical protein